MLLLCKQSREGKEGRIKKERKGRKKNSKGRGKERKRKGSERVKKEEMRGGE